MQRISAQTFTVLILSTIFIFGVVGAVVVGYSRPDHTRKVALPTTTIVLPQKCRQIAQGALPDRKCTPGKTNQAVTQRTIKRTICKSGWASSVRPSVSYTEPLKEKMVRRYGYGDASLRLFQFDHLIPLEIGGNPSDIKNLWPEPYKAEVNGKQAGAAVKDYWEDKLNAEICKGQITLAKARKFFVIGGWVNGS